MSGYRLTEEDVTALGTGCYGIGEYPCCERYTTRQDRRRLDGTVIPKGTPEGGEMLDAAQTIADRAYAAGVRDGGAR